MSEGGGEKVNEIPIFDSESEVSNGGREVVSWLVEINPKNERVEGRG